MKVILRDYQDTSVNGIRRSIARGKKAPLLVLPTGGGKTVCFSHIMESAHAKGNRCYLLVHRKELLLQASRHLYRLGVPHGRISPGHSMTRDRIQIASVQTLVNRLDRYEAPDIIVIDECHHSLAKTWRDIIAKWPNALIIGVTATPRLLSGKGLGKHVGGVFDDIVIGPSPGELMRRGFLTEAVVYAPKTAIDLSDVDIVAGDYAKGQLAKKMDKPPITGDAVAHYKKICPGLPAIAFCASVEAAQNTADAFKAAGFRSVCLDGSLTDEVRAKAIDDLGNGRIDVLTSCEIISEGTDIPVVTVAIMLRPTASEALFMQQAGRVLRPVYKLGMPIDTDQQRLEAIAASKKPFAIILDHAGNTSRHGFVEDEREWSLDGKPPKKRKKAEVIEIDIKIKQCPKCYRCHKPGPVCPSCGHVYESRPRQVEQAEGELIKVDKEAAAAARRKEIGQARSLDALVALAKDKGYSKGWVKKMSEVRHMKIQKPDPNDPEKVQMVSVTWKDIDEAYKKAAGGS